MVAFKRLLFKEFLKFMDQVNGKNLKDINFVAILPCGSKVVIKLQASKGRLRLVKIG